MEAFRAITLWNLQKPVGHVTSTTLGLYVVFFLAFVVVPSTFWWFFFLIVLVHFKGSQRTPASSGVLLPPEFKSHCSHLLDWTALKQLTLQKLNSNRTPSHSHFPSFLLSSCHFLLRHFRPSLLSSFPANPFSHTIALQLMVLKRSSSCRGVGTKSQQSWVIISGVLTDCSNVRTDRINAGLDWNASIIILLARKR